MASGPRFYSPQFRALDDDGVIVPRARLYFYLTLSATPTPTYSNQTLTVANANPVVADDAGWFPDIFLDPAISYKVRLANADDGINPPTFLRSWDPVTEAWPATPSVFFDIPFEFMGGTPPASLELMGGYTALKPQRIFGDFDGRLDGYYQAQGNILILPTVANLICSAWLNDITQVGTMTVSTVTGAYTFATNGGAPVDLDTGEFINFRGPVVVNATAADLIWTIPGMDL